MADWHPDPVRFPNTRRRVSTVHVDGANHQDMRPSADPDTCRICRGEGSPGEPLFYPCKCSGSIKYVHQDCLMEWLSHSQKKHCELCKTPFRFTKLYDPNMPKALPPHIFVSHMARYLFRNLLVWLRAALVASVWLGWLPYLMRSVWSFLFWISDEGLGGRSALLGSSNLTTGDALDLLSVTRYGADLCPASPLFAATTTAATVRGVIDSLPPESVKLVKGLYAVNLTSSDPVYSIILRLLFGSVGPTQTRAPVSPSATVPELGNLSLDSSCQQSLLSGVGFLRNLTRHPSINRAVVAVLEGQIITILVIVCFILIILVRDYVVQQQPEINMRAAFAAIENLPQEPVRAPEPPAHHHGEAERLVEPHQEPFDNASDEEAEPPVADPEGATDELPARQGRGSESPLLPRQASSSSVAGLSTGRQSLATIGESSHALAGPHLPPTDMQGFERTTVHEYLRIYREADGDPERILRIARERNLEDRLAYWLRLTRSMVDRNARIGAGDPDASHQPEAEGASSGMPRFDGSVPLGPVSDATRPGVPQNAADPKGKGKLTEDENTEEPAYHEAAGPLRPRANTDGAKISSTIHPLANNNWTFTDIPSGSSQVPSFPEPSMTHLQVPRELDYRDPYLEQDHDERAVDSSSRPRSPVANTPDGSWQETGDSEPTPETSSVNESHPAEAVTETQPTDSAAARREPAGLVDRVADFMWREADNIDPRELAPVDFLGDFARPQEDEEIVEDNAAGEMERVGDGADPPVPPGLDAEAIDDAEDLDGILELLGMRGPVAGLFQNAIFCAFLVSITIFVGIFLPYNIGRIAVWTVANPVRPARMLFSLSKFVQDCCLIVVGLASSTLAEAIHVLSRTVGLAPVAAYTSETAGAFWAMVVSAAHRVGSSFVTELPIISPSEVRNFSAVSHEALLAVKGHIVVVSSALWHLLTFLLGGEYSVSPQTFAMAANISTIAWEGLKGLPMVVTHPSSWVLNLSLPEATVTPDPALAYWGGMDRFWAVLAGYFTLSLIAALYLRRGAPFSSGQAGQEWEASIIDGLNQASGVMKVILIIGIEMLVFPLYCGMLLDVALLPLFENATLTSRLLFTVNYPITSIFVHWFVGTGYMFHFALFVSMCRKIMRKGVLYFIRDPDDPEFHPVRDVLERNVTTQLRKILFSAFVYGALVMVCLGGVVWGLWFCLPGVLPIHYSSNEPVLEFPLDLLFYNFLMPMAVSFYRPSDGLHAMYTWWFRRCARVFRVTWFLFGERRVDEEGRLVLKSDSPDRNLPFWRKLFLEVDGDGEVAARTWHDMFEGGTAKPGATIPADQMLHLNARKVSLVRSGQLIPDGRFVRTPASDQVKIPKGRNVFLDVTESNTRLDGMADQSPPDIYSTDQYQFVYVPPHFRVRVFLFILFIWIFAAVTGVSITIVPLVFGRWVFKLLIPPHIRTNDIYAFSIGIYMLGSAAYALFHARSAFWAVWDSASTVLRCACQGSAVRRAARAVARVARVVYTYFFVLVVLPLLIASLMELYALIPLHELMYGVLLSSDGRRSVAAAGTATEANPAHRVRIVQSWTIGLLYLKLGLRILNTWFEDTRLATAARAVPRRGFLDPDVSVLTRAFIVPSLAIWLTAVATPLLFAKVTVARGLAAGIMRASGMGLANDGAPSDQALYDAYLVLIYRLSFPFMALGVVGVMALWSLLGVFRSWHMRIRDEAYLIGERLHNFGATHGAPRPRRAWRAGGTRL